MSFEYANIANLSAGNINGVPQATSLTTVDLTGNAGTYHVVGLSTDLINAPGPALTIVLPNPTLVPKGTLLFLMNSDYTMSTWASPCAFTVVGGSSIPSLGLLFFGSQVGNNGSNTVTFINSGSLWVPIGPKV
jgi:hypothetical protein